MKTGQISLSVLKLCIKNWNYCSKLQYCGMVTIFKNYHQLLGVQEIYSAAIEELLQNNRNSSECMLLKNTM